MTFEEHIKLASLTTFKIGGNARYFCRVTSLAELKAAIQFASERGLKILVLGGGSNVLIPDDGFSGLVIKIDILGIEFTEAKNAVQVLVGAGEAWDYLVALTVGKGLYGIENLSGIPGTVGAAPVQNIGAYGAELQDVVAWVKIFDPKIGKERRLSRAACKFGYRDSIFKNKGSSWIITQVCLTLSKQGRTNISYRDLKDYFEKKNTKEPALTDVRAAVLSVRSKKFPDLTKTGTAGSFFKNPIIPRQMFLTLKKKYPELPAFPVDAKKVKLSLAWIIDHLCNLKGAHVNAAIVSDKQALVICNQGGASARDVLALAEKIKACVQDATGISIENEVCYVS